MSRDILLTLIDPDPSQPRKNFEASGIADLAQSMRANGLAVPVLLRPAGERFLIVHGERRYRAALSLGWSNIPAEVRELSDEEARWLALVENVQRSDLSPIEEAEAYRAAQAAGITQTALGERIGKSQSYIAQKLRLLRLPDSIRYYLDRRAITEGHARQVLRLRNFYGEDIKSEFEWPEKIRDIDNELPEVEAWILITFELMRDFRPEDNPPVWIPPTATLGEAWGIAPRDHPLFSRQSTVAEGCKVIHRRIVDSGLQLPTWEVKAFWWLSLVVLFDISVADFDKMLDLWIERLYSAIAHAYAHPAPPKQGEINFLDLNTARYYGYRSDVRHAGLACVLEDPESYFGAFIMPAFQSVTQRGNRFTEPSSLQPWGTQYERCKAWIEDEQRWQAAHPEKWED